MINRDEVVKSARSYIGTRFRLHGRDRTGVDCVGLLFCIGRDLGIIADDYSDYARTPVPEKLNGMLTKYTSLVDANPPRNGRVLKLRQLMWPMHIGILCVSQGRLSVINASVHKHKVSEDSWEEWSRLVIEHREIKGVGG